jgi:hypothetical protein
MAAGALAAGYGAQGAGGNQGSGMTGLATIGLSIGAAAERKNIREQQAQKEFTEKREAFKKDQQDLYDGIAYEDQFEDTGLTDLDEAGQKFADTLRSEYELNNQMYEMGYIDEQEVRKRNARMKGQVKHLKEGVYGKMTAFKENYDKLTAEGKESEADALKLQMMESMTKNISFGVDGAGNVEMRTPGTGEVAVGPDGKIDPSKATRVPLSKFNDLLRNENGVDLDNVTKGITDLEGAGDIYRAGSREYTRYTGFGADGGRQLSKQQDELMGTAIAGMSQTEKIDALSRLGGVYSDKAEFDKLSAEEKKDAVFIDSKDVMGYGAELEQEIDQKLKMGLNNKLMNELIAKESSKPYDDPLERAKGMARISQSTKKPLVNTLPILGTDANDGRGDRIQIAPTDLKGLQASGLTENDRFKKSAMEEVNKYKQAMGPMYTDATFENAKVVGANDFIDEGILQVEFEFEIRVPDPEDPDKFITQTRQTKIEYDGMEDRNKFMTGFGLKGYSSKDFYEERARKAEGNVPPISMSQHND